MHSGKLGVLGGVAGRGSVVECARPLALLERRVEMGKAIESAQVFGWRRESGRGLPHSTTLPRWRRRPGSRTT